MSDWLSKLSIVTPLNKPLESGTEYYFKADLPDGAVSLWSKDKVLLGELKDGKIPFAAGAADDEVIVSSNVATDQVGRLLCLQRGDFRCVPAPEDLIHAKEYELSEPLIEGQEYTITVEGDIADWVGVWLGDDYFTGYLQDNWMVITTPSAGIDTIILKTLSGEVILDTIILTVGNLPQDWRPYAPSISSIVTKSTFRLGKGSNISAKAQSKLKQPYRGTTSKQMAEIVRKIQSDNREYNDKMGSLDEARYNATELMANMLGGHYIEDNGVFYISNDPDISKATEYWKWGLGGYAHYKDGVLDTAITADGSIVAMLVTAGIVTADMVKTGLLQSIGGESWIDLDTGFFKLGQMSLGSDGFKLDVAYGQRNYLLQSNKAVDFAEQSDIPTTVQANIPEYDKNPLDLEYAVQYALAEPLEPGVVYTLSIDGDIDAWTGLWLGTNYFAGYVDNGTLSFSCEAPLDSDVIIIKSFDQAATIDRVMLSQSTTRQDWQPAYEDVQSSIREKANQTDLEQTNVDIADINTTIGNVQNDLSGKANQSDLDALGAEVQTKVDMDGVQSAISSYTDLLEEIAQEQQSAAASVSALLNRVTGVEINLGEKSAAWNFIETSITMADEGIFVGSEDQSNGVLVAQNRISFVQNGDEVAFISESKLHIAQGVFLKSLTIDGYQFQKETGTNLLTLKYVGGS